MKHVLSSVISITSCIGEILSNPELYFQSRWMGRALWLAVKNSTLRWPMGQGGDYGIFLLNWLRVRYESEDKLDPLKTFYPENIRPLKLKANGSILDFIDLFRACQYSIRKLTVANTRKKSLL